MSVCKGPVHSWPRAFPVGPGGPWLSPELWPIGGDSTLSPGGTALGLLDVCARPCACFSIPGPKRPRLWTVTGRERYTAQQAEGNGKVPEDRRMRGQNRDVSFGYLLVTGRLKSRTLISEEKWQRTWVGSPQPGPPDGRRGTERRQPREPWGKSNINHDQGPCSPGPGGREETDI